MTVEIQLLATFSSYLPPGSRGRKCTLEVPEGTTVGEVITRLGLPADYPKIILRNGMNVSEETPLAKGDLVSVFPPLAGGAG